MASMLVETGLGSFERWIEGRGEALEQPGGLRQIWHWDSLYSVLILCTFHTNMLRIDHWPASRQLSPDASLWC